MPKRLHKKAKLAARKKGLKGEAFKRYVYGTLAKYEQRKAYKKRAGRRRARP